MTNINQIAWDDTVLPFQLDRSGVRGRVARLDGVLEHILSRHDYPPAVSATFANGVVDSLPIVIGYVPVAFAFGLSAVKLGFSPLESLFFSCIIYAGASQFVITALLSAGMSLWVSALTVMAMDVRHLLYGPALRHRIVSRMSPGKTAMWAFGLTDEVFAAATAKLMRNNRSWSENWMLGIALCSWLSWVAGTALGAHATGTLRAGAWLLGSAEFLDAWRPDEVLVVGRPTLGRSLGRLLRRPEISVTVVDQRCTWTDPHHAATRYVRAGALALDGAADQEWASAWAAADTRAVAAVADALGLKMEFTEK